MKIKLTTVNYSISIDTNEAGLGPDLIELLNGVDQCIRGLGFNPSGHLEYNNDGEAAQNIKTTCYDNTNLD